MQWEEGLAGGITLRAQHFLGEGVGNVTLEV